MGVIANFLTTKTGVTLTRLFYLIPGVVFLYLLFDDQRKWFFESSFGVDYLALFGAAAGVFLYQSLRNSWLGWCLVLMLYMIYGFETVKEFDNWYFLVGVKNDIKDIWYWVLFFVIYLLIGAVLFIIRPGKRFI